MKSISCNTNKIKYLCIAKTLKSSIFNNIRKFKYTNDKLLMLK